MLPYEETFAYRLLLKFESMRERIQHYVSVANVCPLPVFITSREGTTVLYVNPAYQRMTGRTEERLQNTDWLEIVHPDDREQVAADWKTYLSTLVDGVQTAHRHRYVNGETGAVVEATTFTTAIAGNGLVGYILPLNCFGFMALGIDVRCPVLNSGS